MEEDITLTEDEAVLAGRITTIDREIDAVDRSIDESVVRGLHSSGAALLTSPFQSSADEPRTALLRERAELVSELQAAVANNGRDVAVRHPIRVIHAIGRARPTYQQRRG